MSASFKPLSVLRYSTSILITGVLLGLLNACTVKTLYNQLDWLLADHIESYVELNNEQQKLLYRHLDRFFLWHKATQLPLYVSWLEDFNQDIHQQNTTQAIGHNFEQFKLLLRTLRARAVEDVTVLLAQLSKEQRAELYQGMEKKNLEFADKFIHISREEQLEQYIERTEDRIEEWLGSLTKAQEALVAKTAGQISPVADYVLQSRRNWQKEFKTVLESNTNRKQLNDKIFDLFVNIEKRRSAKYRALSLHNQTLFTKLIVDVAHIMTPGQKRHLKDKVGNYSYHFTELAWEAMQESRL
ncbi:MAG: DUF6279 family lipoprotein [Gammaproteobacteria bacterium]|nr:DUF6279 family lipoprotein [Gammaproteobacteria bacterium]